MKKLMSIITGIFFILVSLGSTSTVMSDNYTVNATTFAVTGTTMAFASGGYPNIAGGVKIDQFIFSSTAPFAQTMQIYNNATSTTAATLAATFQLPSSTGNVTINFPYYNPLTLTNFAVRKSTISTTDVHVNVNYR